MLRRSSSITIFPDKSSPVGLREHDVSGSDGAGRTALDAGEEQEDCREPVRILCSSCGHRLTTADARSAVDGAHRHVKVNPHGHVFHIACFRPLPGVAALGAPSEEFSWFSGYRWQIALCGNCHVHLGWLFSGDTHFGALIEGRFIEDGADKAGVG